MTAYLEIPKVSDDNIGERIRDVVSKNGCSWVVAEVVERRMRRHIAKIDSCALVVKFDLPLPPEQAEAVSSTFEAAITDINAALLEYKKRMFTVVMELEIEHAIQTDILRKALQGGKS